MVHCTQRSLYQRLENSKQPTHVSQSLPVTNKGAFERLPGPCCCHTDLRERLSFCLHVKWHVALILGLRRATIWWATRSEHDCGTVAYGPHCCGVFSCSAKGVEVAKQYG